MRFRELTVELHKSRRADWSARIKQKSSEGVVYGDNLLGDLRPVSEEQAQGMVERILKGKVERIKYEVVKE